MRVICLVLSLFALGACGRADASTTSLPTLAVEYVQTDSARVIATWRRPCDARGCADSYRVQWTAGAVSRLRNTGALAETLFVARPAFGDSLVVTVAVTALRRGLSGVTRTSSATVRNPDAPPPPVDSLRVDTAALRLQLAEIAQLDSYPVIVPRDTLGRSAATLAVGDSIPLCALSRNRYTGIVTILVPGDAPAWADTLLARTCERARTAYEAERSG